jgi:hypothetical protein
VQAVDCKMSDWLIMVAALAAGLVVSLLLGLGLRPLYRKITDRPRSPE